MLKLLNKLFFKANFLKIIMAGLFFLFYFYFVKFRIKNIMIDSDFSNFVLEANDIIHGNFFLNDWQLTGLTFISTDLPYYSLMTLLFGIDIKSYAYASVLIFLVFVCACYFLVKDKLRISFFYKVIFFCIACLPCEFAFFDSVNSFAQILKSPCSG